jgi:hypothetical protein
MGMLLRRNDRKPDYTPTVNGKMVEDAPKNRSLTKEHKESPKDRSGVTYTRNGK